ncbi:MAG: hypothetical protein J6C24_02110 [Clostridia bacterium]|nr:hypothetical protein [Clostridia bacterium]
MESNNNTNANTSKKKDYYVIDLWHIIKAVWHRAWVVVLSAVIVAVAGFSVSAFAIKPLYSSSVMMYVNNSSFSLGNTSFSISSSEISAAQSLLKTYIVILNNRTTLEAVIDKAGVEYSYKQLSGMISSSSVNDTEVLRVTVTGRDPYEAAKIANCIAEVLPVRISEVIEGSSMKVVDSGVVNLQKVSPSITKYTAVGFFIGAFLSVAVLVIIALMDDTIHDEEYIIEAYNYPILAKVPDLTGVGHKKGYYSYYKKHGYNDYSTKKDGE